MKQNLREYLKKKTFIANKIYKHSVSLIYDHFTISSSFFSHPRVCSFKVESRIIFVTLLHVHVHTELLLIFLHIRCIAYFSAIR